MLQKLLPVIHFICKDAFGHSLKFASVRDQKHNSYVVHTSMNQWNSKNCIANLELQDALHGWE